MPDDKNIITVGVSFTPIVKSVNAAKVNEIISLELISGLNYYDIKWINGDIEVDTNPNSTVIFTISGIYKPKVIGHVLEVPQYWITVSEK